MTKRQVAMSLGFVALLALLLGLAGCTSAPAVWGDAKSPRVVVTIAPLASFVKNVGGEHVAIKCLCTEKGPHHYEGDVHDALYLREANDFFAIGLDLEKFSDKMSTQSRNPKLRYVQLGKELPEKLKLEVHHEHDEHADHKDAHGHDHGHSHGAGADPHVWLGIPQAKAMVAMIRDELKRSAPEHAADYDANAKAYLQRLDALHKEGKEALAPKKNKKIVSFHESLPYFADSFGIKIVESIEDVPGEPPSPAKLADLVEDCKKEDVHVIAVEPQYSQNTSAATLVKALPAGWAKLVTVDPLETADEKDLQDPKWYEMRMRKNIEELAKALP